ncbi:MAG: alcohol dehydrogenase catalytic domain-containing protein [Phycisphaerae bacterium]|jgi:threonine dehydrogenase-like Zn-dependent dehydrogenase
MLAMVFDGKAMLKKDYPAPQPSRGEALVAVRLAGVCSTDLEVLKGYMGFTGVMGHEFVGQVVEGPAEWKAKRVVAEINCVCGRCDMCRSGLSNHCRDRTVIGIAGRDGVFAQQVALPAANLHEVPASVSDEQAVFAEPLAAAYQITRQVTFQPSDTVVVLGDGRLGQLVARVLRPMARKLVLVGKHASKLEVAEKQGIETIRVEDFRPQASADVVVEATGSPAGLELAMRAVRPRGKIVLKSTFAAAAGLNLSPLVVDEITVIGSRCGPMDQALAALAGGKVDVSALISRRYPLEQATDALKAAADPRNIKVLIDVR